MISTISSMGKVNSKAIKDTPTVMRHNDAEQQQAYKEDNKQVEKVQSSKPAGKQEAISTHSGEPILRYAPKSRCKEGESPFTGVVNGDVEHKVIKKANEASMIALKGSATVPTLKAWKTKVSRPPLFGFVFSSTGSDSLLNTRAKEGFDSSTYKFMEKASYDVQNPTTLGKLVEAKPHGLNETQRKIQEQGGSVGVSKVGLGFMPSKPIKISGRRKGK